MRFMMMVIPEGYESAGPDGIVGFNTVEIALDETPQAEGGRESDEEPCKSKTQRLP